MGSLRSKRLGEKKPEEVVEGMAAPNKKRKLRNLAVLGITEKLEVGAAVGVNCKAGENEGLEL